MLKSTVGHWGIVTVSSLIGVGKSRGDRFQVKCEEGV